MFINLCLSADIIYDMKILQISNIYLGRSFEEYYVAGNKLRTGIKSTFSKIIEVAGQESVDLAVLAGDIFDNHDLSQNVLGFFISEIEKLGDIPVVLLPGMRDSYLPGSFWDLWKITPPSKNLYLLADNKAVTIELPAISTAIYGFPVNSECSLEEQLKSLQKSDSAKNHIAVMFGNSEIDKEFPAKLDLLKPLGFDYIAVGGPGELTEFQVGSIKAAASGSPLVFTPNAKKSGGLLLADISEESVSITSKELKGFEWRETEISMESFLNLEDLKKYILDYAGQNTILRAKLTGLTLLDVGLNIEQLKSELEEHFLALDFDDQTRVLPENISEVKVQEKTILGQYLKVMVEKLNSADEDKREKIEKSLKVGYSLLSGREIW